MADEMFFSEDDNAMRRGSRIASRTETCRPCLVWDDAAGEPRYEGVALDLNPHGLLVRMLEAFPVGTVVQIQLMRDEDYKHPLTQPLRGRVIRHVAAGGGMLDHGIKLIHEKIRREESTPVEISKPPRVPVHKARMHTIDLRVGDERGGRSKT